MGRLWIDKLNSTGGFQIQRTRKPWMQTLAAASTVTPAAAWLGTWAKRLELTIDSSKIDTGDLTDFPVMIKLSAASGIGDVDASAVFDELTSDANRKKIAVTSSDAITELYCEIEKWDDVSEEAWLHVKVPSIAYNADTIIYLYYDSTQDDNDSYVGDTTDAVTHNVWDADFVAVYHMAQDPNGDGADAIKDSTSNANDGTPVGTMLTADLVTGQVGQAIDFDGVDDYLTTPYSASLDLSAYTSFTIEGVNDAGSGVSAGIWANYYDNVTYHEFVAFYATDTGKIYFQLYRHTPSQSYIWQADDNQTDAFHHYVVTHTNAADPEFWVDGASAALTATSTVGDKVHRNDGGDNLIGCNKSHTSFYPGISDETRISKITRSDAWIKATYNSLWDSLVTFGVEETP